MRPLFKIGVVSAMFVALTFVLTLPAWAQTTISTGSIQGTVSDPSGSVVPNATVTISNRDTSVSFMPQVMYHLLHIK